MSSSATELRAAVIGYGSLLRGDDAAGPIAVERFESRVLDGRVHCEIVHQLAPEIAELISRAERVVFVDAACDCPPGQIDVRPVAASENSDNAMAHRVSPGSLLTSAVAWYGRAGRAFVVTIGGLDFDLGRPLSQPVLDAMDDYVTAIANAAGVRIAPSLPAEHGSAEASRA